MKVFYVYQHNTTDHRDDNVLKVRAHTAKEALEIADCNTSDNFRLGRVYAATDFRREWPEWWQLIKSQPGVVE